MYIIYRLTVFLHYIFRFIFLIISPAFPTYRFAVYCLPKSFFLIGT